MTSAVQSTEYSVDEPLNREPPVDQLVKNFITKEGAYDRNHGPIPHLVIEEHRLNIDGKVPQTVTLSVQQLRHEYTHHTVTAALQCAGNRRHTMRTKLKEVSGLDWFDAAVMNCEWTGPKLRDVLIGAGLKDEAGSDNSTLHVQFACHAAPQQDADWYGASIPLERALRDTADVILAMEMNGKPLTFEHGFPLRVIIPGIIGARSVKWLDQITIAEQESQNHYMQRDYKVLPPDAIDAESAEKYWETTPPLMAMPCNSVVAHPTSGDTVELGVGNSDKVLEVKGYALPYGDDGPIIKVEVSLDDRKTWQEAELVNPGSAGKWAWSLWTYKVTLQDLARVGKQGEDGRKGVLISILSKATDAGGNTQEDCEWNLRGVGYNGYGEAQDVRVSF